MAIIIIIINIIILSGKGIKSVISLKNLKIKESKLHINKKTIVEILYIKLV